MADKHVSSSAGAGPSNVERADSTSDQPIQGFESIDQFTQQGLRSVLGATKSSNDLPAPGDDFDYYSSFDSFRNVMEVEGRRLIHLMKRILRHQGVKGTLEHTDHLDPEDTFDVLADANDHILERVGSSLDEASGVKTATQTLVVASIKGQTTPQASWNKKSPSTSGKSYRLLAAHNIKRPQLKFRDKVDNANKPFVPIIRTKPNALQSLADSLMIPVSQDANHPSFLYPHPYQYELDQFSPLPEQFEKVEPQMPDPVSLTAPVFVQTASELAEMVDYLKTEKEIAVDLEHHSYRTFQGFTCLLQLSSRTRDYLVDALELRADMYILNEVLTDPAIVKVFHGADSDIEWLQRDFGLYVVNMFDTGQAARVLNYSRFSLAHLLQMYCQVNADKQYQLADWRIRPLPAEMMKYAQEDTHYLLYIYDLLKNELIEKGNAQRNLLRSVLQRSTQLCGKVYRKNVFTDESYLNLYHQSKKVFNSQQLHCLKRLYEWRDKIARLEDESTGYVLPKHMLLQIADILPRERQGILACCNPTPPLIRQCVNELHGLIMEAREIPLIKVQKERRQQSKSSSQPCVDTSQVCSHDLSHTQCDHDGAEAGTLLLDSSLLTGSSALFASSRHSTVPVKENAILSAFSSSPKDLPTPSQKKARCILESFHNPFDMYLPHYTEHMGKTDNKSHKPTTGKQPSLWKLVKNTSKEDIVKKPKELKGPRPEDKPIITKEEEDTMVPLSHQFQNPKKRKKQDDCTVPSSQAEQPKQKVGKVSGGSSEAFKPYDYSQANMKMFEAGSHRGRKRHIYDPDGARQKMKEHKVHKSKLPAGAGKKSYTFGKGGKSSSKRDWPSRRN
ncbi:exosome complex component 10-like [Liolophura sinensis]|uniref:exosome complex component 10-like n=1 Tax=Liolophura sinensis TaxID=3198878 RepID=UPI0031581741